MHSTQNAVTRVVVAHRVPLVQEGIAASLSRCLGMHVMQGVASSSDSIRRTADVVVADYETGLQLLRGWQRQDAVAQAARPKVLIVADDDRESTLCAALEAGVDGVTLVDCELEELYSGLKHLSRGARYLSPALVSRLADGMTREPLTAREKDVLALIVHGSSNKAIARELDIALGTVKAHVRTLLSKLGAGTRTQAVGIAQQRGLIGELKLPSPGTPAPGTPAPIRILDDSMRGSSSHISAFQ